LIVVDASAAVLGMLNDGDARRMLAAEPLATPHLADSEITQALRAQAMRGAIGIEDARRALGAWSRLGIERFAVTGLLDRVWELRDSVTAYDATYVALAEALGCALLTADARLGGATGPKCPVTVVRR
jgi:predicted nucleic acid-binding protein